MTTALIIRRVGAPERLPPAWRSQARLAIDLLTGLERRFPGDADRRVCLGFVPGRIELVGRHTDYGGGRSIVCAIDRGFLFAATAGAPGRVRMVEDRAEFEPVDFPLDSSLSPRLGHWANYPMTMARRLSANFGREKPLAGMDVVFSSTMPVGSGMSGSSALMMMTFTALAAVNDLADMPVFRRAIRNPVDLAVYLACVENGQGFGDLAGDRGVGTFGGSEDHAAILNARGGFVSLFGFCPASLQQQLVWPRGWSLAVAFSGVRAEKTGEALEKYNMVSRRASEAVRVYNEQRRTTLATLREVVDHALMSEGVSARRVLRTAVFWQDLLDRHAPAHAPSLGDRVRHFIVEDRLHITEAREALTRGDLDRFGRMLTASHRASKRYLWNIAPEIDFLQRSALRAGASGASGFGAGFGGSILAVVRSGEARRFLAAWQGAYGRRYPHRAQEATFFLAAPAPGIEVWEKGGPVMLADLLFPDFGSGFRAVPP